MIDAMKMALAALETCDVDYDYDENPYNTFDAEDVSEAIEALRQAIAEAEKESTLQEISDIGQEAHTDHPMRHWDRTCPACVEQAKKQEPVAWMYIEPDNEFKTVHIDDCDYSQFPNDEWFPVYTAPPKRPVKSFSGGVPWYATEEPISATTDKAEISATADNKEIERLKVEVKRLQDLAEYRLKLLMQMPENKPWVNLTDEEIDYLEDAIDPAMYRVFARRIEAKLRERNK